jgi:hypothetical protein
MLWQSVGGTRAKDPGLFKVFEKEAKCNLVEKENNNASRGMQSSDAVRDQVSYTFMGRMSYLVWENCPIPNTSVRYLQLLICIESVSQPQQLSRVMYG